MTGDGNTNKHLAHRGFSLVETMVGLGILLIGIAGFAASFQSQISKSVASRNQAQAAIVAQSVLTELSDSNPSEWDVSEIGKKYLYDFEGHLLANNVADATQNAYYTVKVTIGEQVANYWNVEIGVEWNGWAAEQEKSGNNNENVSSAYVLNTKISPYVSVKAD